MQKAVFIYFGLPYLPMLLSIQIALLIHFQPLTPNTDGQVSEAQTPENPKHLVLMNNII